jgi:hypothetical protein
MPYRALSFFAEKAVSSLQLPWLSCDQACYPGNARRSGYVSDASGCFMDAVSGAFT